MKHCGAAIHAPCACFPFVRPPLRRIPASVETSTNLQRVCCPMGSPGNKRPAAAAATRAGLLYGNRMHCTASIKDSIACDPSAMRINLLLHEQGSSTTSSSSTHRWEASGRDATGDGEMEMRYFLGTLLAPLRGVRGSAYAFAQRTRGSQSREAPSRERLLVMSMRP